jgi:hypothetical protein
MDDLTRIHLVKRYLSLTHSTIHQESETDVDVTFSEEADRALTRRPFYWAFIDRTGAPAQPMSYSLHVYAAPQSCPYPSCHVAYPSPFFTDMINDINEKGRLVQCFEVVPRGGIPQFETWLHCTIRISCFGSSANRLHLDLGISLLSGEIRADFLTWLGQRTVQAHFPSTFHNPTTFTMEQARTILQAFIGEQLSALNMGWAVEAYTNFEQECAIADGFEARIGECALQLRPRIEVEVQGAGLFHLLRQARHE